MESPCCAIESIRNEKKIMSYPDKDAITCFIIDHSMKMVEGRSCINDWFQAPNTKLTKGTGRTPTEGRGVVRQSWEGMTLLLLQNPHQ